MRLFRCLLLALSALLTAIPASAAWHQAKSKHFIIYADLNPTELRSYAERLERFDQAVRYVRGMADPALTDSERLTVFALQSESAVARLAGIGSSVRGFYRGNAAGAYMFVPRRAGSRFNEFDLDSDAIFFHEYAHHLQLRDTSVALPAWVVEGFAEFFATAEVRKDGSVRIGKPPLYRVYALHRLNALTIEEMLGGTPGRRMSEDERHQLYARGWLLNHYLTFQQARKGQLVRYLQEIQRGIPALQAARTAFGDLQALDRELDRYMRGKITVIDVEARVLPIGNVDVRALSPAESAMIGVHIRSRRGVNPTTGPVLAADARKAAAPYPNDPFVQSALAEAEYDARNYAAADAAADRALAANPNHVPALIYKARGQMALSRGMSDPARWDRLRDWLLKANKLDTENAEPLALYYRSFVEARERPTRNAIDGLLYSVDLAPQDRGLRIMAVRALLLENRAAEAKALLAPLAYRPHAAPEFREAMDRAMAALTAGDVKTALGVLDNQPGRPAGGS